MNNKKVLFLTSLLAATALAGCNVKATPAMILPEASQVEEFDNGGVSYPKELLTNHRVAGLMVNGTLQLEASEQFGYEANNVSYECQDTSIATVDENGLVTGVSGGETKIVVTDKNNPDFKREVPVIVYPEIASTDISGVTTALKNYENAHEVTEVVQRKRIVRTFSKRPVKENPEDPDEKYVQYSYDYSDEEMVFSVDEAYLRITETDSEVRTTDGGVDFADYEWIFHTNRYFDTLVYHQTGDMKTFYSAPTQDYMGRDRKDPLYDVLDNLFTVGHSFFENQLDNASFGDVTDIAENDYNNVKDKVVGSLGNDSLFVRGVLTFDDSTADNDDERNYGIPVGTPTPTSQDSTWIVKDNRVQALYYYLVQDYVIDNYEYQMIMDIDIELNPMSEDRHEINVPPRDEYQRVDMLFDI